MRVNWAKVIVFASILVVVVLAVLSPPHQKLPVLPLPAPVAVVEKPLPPTVTREKRAPAPKKVEKPEPAPKSHAKVKTCKDVPAQAYTMSVDSVVEIAKRQGLNNYTVEKLRNCLTNRHH